jgi:hypothetical protein
MAEKCCQELATLIVTVVDEDRIAGGYDAKNNKPWIVKVWLERDSFLCGGTLINKRSECIYQMISP